METRKKSVCPCCGKRVRKLYCNGSWWGMCQNGECDMSIHVFRVLSRHRNNGIYLWEGQRVEKSPGQVQVKIFRLATRQEVPYYIKDALSESVLLSEQNAGIIAGSNLCLAWHPAVF